MISRRTMMNDKIVSQSGDTLLLEECKGSYLNGLRVFGKSTQFTTTGAQLIDLSDQIGKTETKNGATYKINDDQSITVSGKPTEYTSFFIKVMTLKAGTYFLNNEASDKNIFIKLIGNGINEGVFTLDEDLLNVGIYVVFNVAENNTKTFNFIFTTMLNEGSIAKPWEPYTGGKPSPSPEYPQEIANVGDDGQIECTVNGKYLPIPDSNVYEKLFLKAGTTLTLQTKDNTKSLGGNILFTDVNGEKLWFAIDSGKTYVTQAIAKDVVGYTNLLKPGVEYYLYIGELTPYKPYKEQVITLQTPNGLPGIPVSSGGNYTDSKGQQWICDEIDLARGKYVQRIGHNANVNDWVDMPGNQDIEPTTSRFALNIENIDNYMYSPCICNRLSYAKVDSYGTEGTYVTINEPAFKRIFARIEGITSLEDFTAAIPDLEVIWLLETPIETDLTAEEIAAYKTVHTYAGTTVIMNDENVGMEVSYRKVRG